MQQGRPPAAVLPCTSAKIFTGSESWKESSSESNHADPCRTSTENVTDTASKDDLLALLKPLPAVYREASRVHREGRFIGQSQPLALSQHELRFLQQLHRPPFLPPSLHHGFQSRQMVSPGSTACLSCPSPDPLASNNVAPLCISAVHAKESSSS